ncbi:MAG: S-layer homology domain-containing protein, partial [Acidimicrobiaceae bacterium]|nr:S-layer homology domain-containing protein [Acidimicrobiaceae bacterium]
MEHRYRKEGHMPHLKGPVPQAQAKEGPMPQLVKKRRSGWAVLAAGALVASLLAVGASPAGAATDTADHEAKTGACVGDALGDQMFTDVSDMHAFKDAINCIAYYGITNGTGDGSTYSPNQDVTRAEMAVFIARAAGVAGADLGDAMGDKFDDLDGVWQEARDAINQLADNGMISSGGDYRPDDAMTRAEMAHFLVGFLAEAAANVTIDSNGVIQLGTGGTAMPADDWFADARAALPRSNDAEVSAIYELGITKGASAAAVQDDTKPPLDLNYEPHGTVNRGEMAAFITRALAHTPARPEGVSAQHDGENVILSARDENFAPVENVVIDVFTTDTGGAGLAFRADGSCGEVSRLGATGSEVGTFLCEIDSADEITGGDGNASVPLDTIADGGTTVWAWTGDNEDKVDGDTDLFRLDIPEGASRAMADRARVSTEHSAAKAHLGSSVLYTVQLQNANGDVTVGTDGKKPANFLVTLTTTALVVDTTDTDPSDGITVADNPQGASVVSTLPLTTDSDGKATFSVSGLPDQVAAQKADKYRVDIVIQPRQQGNAPENTMFYIGNATTAATPGGTGLITVGNVIFSTEDAARDAARTTVSVKPAADFVAAAARGASARATVSVTDQYGDAVPNVWCSLATSGAGDHTIGGNRNVGSDGAYTFRYERVGDTAATETLTASCDQDGDTDTAADTGSDTVEWAAPAGATGTGADIRQVDTDANIIFAGDDGSVAVLRYDSNDRFNIDADGSGAGVAAASTYAAFEKSISDADTLTWAIVGSGSRAVN